MNIPKITNLCPTCFSPNVSLRSCPQCERDTMCSNCASAGLCDSCRKLVSEGKMEMKKTIESDPELKNVVLGVLVETIRLIGPKQLYKLKILTEITEKDFEELFKTLLQSEE